MINKILNFAITILTPGVLVLAFIVVNEILDETITWDKLSFALVIFIAWGIAYYYNRTLKGKARSTKGVDN